MPVVFVATTIQVDQIVPRAVLLGFIVFAVKRESNLSNSLEVVGISLFDLNFTIGD